MLLTKEVTMNLNYRGNPIVLDALQGDSCRALTVHLVSGEAPWVIPEAAAVILQYECSDGTGGAYDTQSDDLPAYSIQGSAITISLIPELFAVPGCTKLQVTFLSEGRQLTTFAIEIHVEKAVNTQISSGEYVNLLRWWQSMENKGPAGDSGVYIGTKAPTDPNVRVWINPAGEGIPVYDGEVL